MTATLPIDTYYRGYRLSTTDSQTVIYHNADRIETITLADKGMCRTTDDAAKDHIDAWVDCNN